MIRVAAVTSRVRVLLGICQVISIRNSHCPWDMSLLSLPERIFRRLVELPLELFSVVLGSQKALKMNGWGQMNRWGQSLDFKPGDTQVALPGGGFGFTRSGRYDPVGMARVERTAMKRWTHYLAMIRHQGLFEEVPGTTPIPLPGRQYRKRGREYDTLPPAGFGGLRGKRQAVERLFVL